jgi:hypothetical protein
MDDKRLVDEILNRVLAKMQISNKPKLLILTEDHGTSCHEVLESKTLLERYDTECACIKNYELDVAKYEAVVLFQLNNTALSKIASGICDSPFLNMVSQAILIGKKIYVPVEEVELYQYKNVAPAVYYDMMLEKINFLKSCGVIFCKREQLEIAILDQKVILTEEPEMPVQKKAIESPSVVNTHSTGKSVDLDKKVITEKDVEKAYSDGAAIICISSKAILSDLAKEFAKNRNIEFQRKSPDGKPGMRV